MIYVLSGNGAIQHSVAQILVSYPSGSAVTATNGTDVVALNDTSGTGTIGVPSLGSWTVSCTDGVNIKSQTVELTENGQTVEIEIHYFEAYIEVTTSGTVFNTQLEFSDGNNNYYHTMADNGTHQLVIYTPGDWTIVGKRDNQTITKTINVSANNSINKVNLIFRQYLFKENSGSYIGWASGGGTYGTSWDTSRTDYIQHNVGGHGGHVTMAYLHSTGSIDLTNYSKFVITGFGTAWGPSESNNYPFGLSTTQGGSLAASASFTRGTDQVYTHTINVSNMNGNYFLVIPGGGSYYTDCYYRLTNIYAE